MRLVGADKPKPQDCKDLEKKEPPDDAADVTRGRRGASEGPAKRGEGRGAGSPATCNLFAWGDVGWLDGVGRLLLAAE